MRRRVVWCRPAWRVCSAVPAHGTPPEGRGIDGAVRRALSRIQASGLVSDGAGEVLDRLPEPGTDLDQWQRQVVEALAAYGPPALYQAVLRLLRRARQALPASADTARRRLTAALRLVPRLGSDLPAMLRVDLEVETTLTEAWCELAEGRKLVAAALTARAEEQLEHTSHDPLLESLHALTTAYIAAREKDWDRGYRKLVRAAAVLQEAEEPFEDIQAEPALARHLESNQARSYPTDERVKVAVRRLLARCEPREPEGP